MPSRRRTSLKSPPLDLDRELDEMYSSPITRPSLGFLRVASAPPAELVDENPTVAAEAATELPDDGDSSLRQGPLVAPISPIAATSHDALSMDTQSGQIQISPDLRSMDIRPAGKWKIHQCSTVQDGHSANEQLLYEMFWRWAKPTNPDERLITISREDMAAQTRITIRNIKGVLDRLIEKLAVERVLESNSFARVAATYRIYSYRSILDRRRKAGLEWVTRANGVRFISTQIAQRILATPKFREGDSIQPAASLVNVSIDTRSIAPISMDVLSSRALADSPRLKDIPVDLGTGLRKINPAFDSAAVARLWRECRSRIPNCTVDEVLHFVAVKANKLRADRNVRNIIGLLLTSVPEFFDPNIISEYRDERQRQIEEEARAAEENQRYWRAVLEDPSASEEDRAIAMQFV